MEEKSRLKKKIVATATAASLLVGGAFSQPADVPEKMQDRISPPAIVEIATPVFVDDDDDDSIAIPEEEKKRRGMKQRLLVAVPLLLVTWVGGIILAAIAMGALTPILGTVAGWFITALLLLVTYVTVAKTLFPGLTLKQILNWKALLAVFLGATLVSIIAKGLVFK